MTFPGNGSTEGSTVDSQSCKELDKRLPRLHMQGRMGVAFGPTSILQPPIHGDGKSSSQGFAENQQPYSLLSCRPHADLFTEFFTVTGPTSNPSTLLTGVNLPWFGEAGATIHIQLDSPSHSIAHVQAHGCQPQLH